MSTKFWAKNSAGNKTNTYWLTVVMSFDRSLGGEVSHDGDFMIFEGNRYSRKGFLFKSFAMSAVVRGGLFAQPALDLESVFHENLLSKMTPAFCWSDHRWRETHPVRVGEVWRPTRRNRLGGGHRVRSAHLSVCAHVWEEHKKQSLNALHSH